MTQGACPHHPDDIVVAACSRCGRPLCPACRDVVAGSAHCRTCGVARMREERRPRPDTAPVLLTLAGSALAGAVFVAVALTGARQAALQHANRIGLERVAYALDDFYLDQGRYPTPQEGLTALMLDDPTGSGTPLGRWSGPYLTEDAAPIRFSWTHRGLLDAWGQPVVYYAELDERWVYVASPGADGVIDSPGLGTLAFSGDRVGDDVIAWVEGP